MVNRTHLFVCVHIPLYTFTFPVFPLLQPSWQLWILVRERLGATYVIGSPARGSGGLSCLAVVIPPTIVLVLLRGVSRVSRFPWSNQRKWSSYLSSLSLDICSIRCFVPLLDGYISYCRSVKVHRAVAARGYVWCSWALMTVVLTLAALKGTPCRATTPSHAGVCTTSSSWFTATTTRPGTPCR